jgi:phage shock protein A
MSIWRSIKNFFRARKDEAAKKLADPIRDGKYAIKDSEKAIYELKSKLAQHIASNKAVAKKIDQSRTDVGKYERLLEVAKVKNIPKDIHSISQKLLSEKEKAVSLKNDFDKNSRLIDSFRAQIEQAEKKISNAANQHTQLSVRMQSAELRESLLETTT